MVDNILSLLAGLAGLGGFISMVVNLLKMVGIATDGTGERWVQGLNLAAFIAVSLLYFLNVNVDWLTLDGLLTFLSVFLGFVVQLLGSRATYAVVKGIPGIGYSFDK